MLFGGLTESFILLVAGYARLGDKLGTWRIYGLI
jgi:hypothetical protein